MAPTKKGLTREELRGRLKREPVDHPAGGVVYVQEMTAADFRAYQKAAGAGVTTDDDGELVAAALGGDTDVIGVMAELCVRTMVDESGERLYADDEKDALLGDNALGFVIEFAMASMRVSDLSSDEGPEDSQDDPTKTSS